MEKLIGPNPMRRDKTISRESLDRDKRANTGGEVLDRATGRYSKNAAPRDYDPDAPLE